MYPLYNYRTKSVARLGRDTAISGIAKIFTTRQRAFLSCPLTGALHQRFTNPQLISVRRIVVAMLGLVACAVG